jgi:hypothetical protein
MARNDPEDVENAMKQTIVGPRRIDLQEAVEDVTGKVEVIVRPVEHVQSPTRRKLREVTRSLSPGRRSKDDIDTQLSEERASWGDS